MIYFFNNNNNNITLYYYYYHFFYFYILKQSELTVTIIIVLYYFFMKSSIRIIPNFCLVFMTHAVSSYGDIRQKILEISGLMNKQLRHCLCLLLIYILPHPLWHNACQR